MGKELNSVSALPGRFSAFMRWWREELVSLLPATLRRQLQFSEHQLVCCFSEGSVQFADCHRAAVAGSVVITPDEQGRLSAAQQAQLSGLRRKAGEQVVLKLPAEQVLSLSFSLPLDAESNLEEVLGYELGRYAPFKIEQVYYGYTIQKRDSAERKLWLAVNVVPRKQVEPLLIQLREWGLQPAVLTAADADQGAATPCSDSGQNLLPKEERSNGGGSANLTVKLLLLLALLLSAALAAYPLLVQKLRIAEMQQQVDTLKKAALSVQSMQQEMERLAAEADYVEEQKRQYPEVLDVLENLTRLLPDDTWLERFEMKGGRIRIQGMSEDASSLIELLENSALLQKVSFDSPIVKDPRTNRFRFQIVAELV